MQPKGLTDAEFDGVATRTIEAWLKFWRDRQRWEGDGHSEEAAARNLALLGAEIEARRRAEGDNRAWTQRCGN